jgi:alkyl hydroperoxide reductase subunit D
MLTVEALLDRLPTYAKDLKLNLGTLLRQPELTPSQVWGTAVASAVASRNVALLEAIEAAARQTVEANVIDGAKGAAAIMGMNNVYYRFTHLVSNEKYGTIPARLRMNFIRTHGVNPVDFELWCVAVSAINGCAACVDSHERVVREKGVTEETVAASVRLGAVIHAIATVLDAEPALLAEPAVAVAAP